MTNDPVRVRERYLHALGILRVEPAEKDMQQAALNRAYELRTFEIGLVWTRATYFFTAQAAIFAAFALLIKENGAGSVAIAGVLALLGLATAWLGNLAAHGARFWQQNWEHHIDLLEDELEGQLHKSVVQQFGEKPFSVSRAQIALTRTQIIFWLIMVGMVPYSFFGTLTVPAHAKHVTLSTILLLAAVVIIGLVIRHGLRSDIRGVSAPLHNRETGRDTTSARRSYVLIQRESPMGWPMRQTITPPEPPPA